MTELKAREKAIRSLLRQQNMLLENLVHDHIKAKERLDDAKKSCSNLQREIGDIEDTIREATSEGAAISVNLLQWQKHHLRRQNSYLADSNQEKNQAEEAYKIKYEELVKQKQKIEAFEKLSDKYQIERNKKLLTRLSHELDALCARSLYGKR